MQWPTSSFRYLWWHSSLFAPKRWAIKKMLTFFHLLRFTSLAQFQTHRVRWGFVAKSKDDDLGTHTLRTGQEFNWEFTPNFFGRTLFFCHFYWDTKDKSFAVFDNRLSYLCSKTFNSNCYWVVKPDGFYLSNNAGSLGSKINTWI